MPMGHAPRAHLGAYTDRCRLAIATNLGDNAALSTAPVTLRRDLGGWTSRTGFDVKADGGRVRPLGGARVSTSRG